MSEEAMTFAKQRDSRGRYVKGHDGQWKPGQSGNPAGPPKDPGITAIQRGMLDEVCPYATVPRQTWREWLALRGLTLAGTADSAHEHLKDRLEGKVALPVKVEGEGIVVTLIREAIGGRKEGSQDG